MLGSSAGASNRGKEVLGTEKENRASTRKASPYTPVVIVACARISGGRSRWQLSRGFDCQHARQFLVNILPPPRALDLAHGLLGASGAVSAQEGEALLGIGKLEWEEFQSTCAFDWWPTSRVVSAEWRADEHVRCICINHPPHWRLVRQVWRGDVATAAQPVGSLAVGERWEAGGLCGSRVDEHPSSILAPVREIVS